jgi:hypothetical protein
MIDELDRPGAWPVPFYRLGEFKEGNAHSPAVTIGCEMVMIWRALL